MRFNEEIIDVHVHTHGGNGVDGFLRGTIDNFNASGLLMENFLCVKHGPSACMTEPEALLAKAVWPGKFSVLGNPTFTIHEGFDASPEGAAEQVQDFIDSGMDGVKLADVNGGIGTPLDSPIFDPMFSTLEKNDAVILYHVGGWAELPARRVFLKNHNEVENPPFLFYHPGIDDDKPARYMQEIADANEKKYAEIENLLSRHPDVKLILPHTYHMAKDLDRLAAFLDRHPNVNIDMTPGPQLYWYMSQDPAKSREFLGDYRKRVLFGTDNTMEQDPMTHIILERMFFETDEEYFAAAWGFDLHGIGLQKEVRDDIYRNNYLRLFPRKDVNPEKAAEYCEKIYDTIRQIPEMPEDNAGEVLECAKRFRENRLTFTMF